MNTIFIVPAAGSMGFEYKQWENSLPENIAISSARYQGRGMRIREGYSRNWNELVEDVYKQLVLHIPEEDYIIFGHSMGSTIAYDLYFKLLKSNKKLPKAICFCGCEAPNAISEVCRSSMEEVEFRDYFLKLGGINEEILESEELTDMLFETLRTDISLLESFNYIDQQIFFEPKILVMNGIFDDVIVDRGGWQQAIKNDIEYVDYEGSHFFVFEQQEKVIDRVISLFHKI